MAVRIRLRRGGKKKQPHYRIVVTDARSPRDGKFIEIIGHYDPLPENEEMDIDKDRLVYWLERGALPSDTVKSLLKKNNIWQDIAGTTESKQAESTEEIELEKEEELAFVEPEAATEDEG